MSYLAFVIMGFILIRHFQVSLLIILTEQKPKHASNDATTTTAATTTGAANNAADQLEDSHPILSITSCAAKLAVAVSRVIAFGERQGRESSNPEFAEQMLSACETLDIAKTDLYVTAQKFEMDQTPKSGQALCQMAKNVLQAVVKVMLVVDTKQVNLILSLVHQTRKSLGVVGSVHLVDQLVPAFRGLTESIVKLKQYVDVRKHDLCSTVCRDQLSSSMSMLRKSIPGLNMAMQTYFKYQNNASAKARRDDVLKQIDGVLDEIEYLIHTGVSASGGRQDERSYCFVSVVDQIMDNLSEEKRQELEEDLESLFVALIEHCLTVANVHGGAYKDIIVTSSHRILQAKFRLLDLHKMMTGSPNVVDIRVEYDNLCETVLDEVCELERQVNMTLLHLIVETFVDTTTPLDRLVKAGLEYNNTQGRPFSDAHSDLIKTFSDYVDHVCQIALLVAASCEDDKKSSEIRSSVQDLETLDPEIVPVVVSVSRQKSDTASIRHLRLLVKRWQLETSIIVKAVDRMIDVRVFLEVTEQKMSKVKDEHIRHRVAKTVAFAVRAAQLGMCVVDNHTDPVYRNGLMVFVRKLTDAINLTRAALNDVLTNSLSSKLSDTLDRRLKLLHGAVLGLRQGLDEKNHPDLLSPERDLDSQPLKRETRGGFRTHKPKTTTSTPKTRMSVTKLAQTMETKLSTTVAPNATATTTTQSRPVGVSGGEDGDGVGVGPALAGTMGGEVEGKVQPLRSTGVGNTLSWPADNTSTTGMAMMPAGKEDVGGGGGGGSDASVKSWLEQGHLNNESQGQVEVSNLQLVINRLLTAATSGDKMSTDTLTSDILGWTNHIVDAGDSLLSHCGEIAQGKELKQLVREVDRLVPLVIQCSKFLVSGDAGRRDELQAKAQDWCQKLDRARIIVDVASDKWMLLTYALTQAISTEDSVQGKIVLESIGLAGQEMSSLLLKVRFLSGRWVDKGPEAVDFLTDCHKDIENMSITISTTVQVADLYTSRTPSERWQFAQVTRDWSVLMTCIVAELDRISVTMETLARNTFPGLRAKAVEKESRLAGVLEEETNGLLELVDCVVIGDPSTKSKSDELVTELNEALSDVVAIARQQVTYSKVPNYPLFCRLRIGLARNRWVETALQVRDLIQNHCFEYSGSVRQILLGLLDFKETGPSEDALQKEQQKLMNDLLELSSCIKQKALACIQLSADLPRRAVLRSSLDAVSALTTKLQDALKDPGLRESDASYLSAMWGAHMKKLVTNLKKLEGIRPGAVAEIERLTKARNSLHPVSMRSHLQPPSGDVTLTQTTPVVTPQHRDFLSNATPLSSSSPIHHQSISVASSSAMSPSLSQSSYASPRGDIGTPLGKSVQVVLRNAGFLDEKLSSWTEEDIADADNDDDEDENNSGVANAYSGANIVKQATAMTSLCSHMALYTRGEGPLKNVAEVVGAAVALTRHSSVLESFGRLVLGMVVDNRCKNDLSAAINALNSLSSQLHIIATALHNSARSFEGERTLARNASNVLSAVKALFGQVEISATQGVMEPGQALDPATRSAMAFLTRIRNKHQRYLDAQRKGTGQLDELGLRRMELHNPPSLTSLVDI